MTVLTEFLKGVIPLRPAVNFVKKTQCGTRRWTELCTGF